MKTIFTRFTVAPRDPSGIVVSLRCPSCRQRGTFDAMPVQDLQIDQLDEPYVVTGQRRCPNRDCTAHVFFAWCDGEVFAVYPPERFDFDPTDIPERVRVALEEAIASDSAQCYTAAAIMVRKTLEELCAEREAIGADLKKRLEALRDKIVLPKALLEGLDEIRLLGNDAAHIESRVYDEIGREEVQVALEFTKEVLKGVYQMDALIKRFQVLKKPGSDGDEGTART